MKSIEDELGSGGALARLLNQAALLDFFAVEMGAVSNDEVLGAVRRDALTAVLDSSSKAMRELVQTSMMPIGRRWRGAGKPTRRARHETACVNLWH